MKSARISHADAPASIDPTWYKDAIIYQIHVKSFFDSNNDGIGDLPGLLAKLDYIAELGVTTIWLLPFYPSPRRDDGYDIADYRNIHQEYGTLRDLRRLIVAAHDRSLRVISELVINHTSDQHPWFDRARRAKPGSSARNFYVWSDNDQRYGGTRIIFVDTEKSNWTWDPVAGAYFWHRFYSHQPDLNFDHPPVLSAVLSIMRFWLDLGVDGLRLDAVPYLVEREGTTNENLPETHQILKRIRAEMDAYAPGRMLLAEANQWPEDAQQYFGDGDECHMAFHFPLMPRMYMAIGREDRFPITDIMRQTPDLPPQCQWAVFLRNHDELTLEMVTDHERDYLWETYASDRMARLNLGIRRRLAPLLERDRRRIELMNSLLLSAPGTPVIYYGDEIGMGDNVHLGDRDGVRTPMQWSPDRNGGFSRVDPARLVLPPIMDSIYGYNAVNVEAQSADPHSLLNWMRRMLAVRKRFRAFGRGTQRFLYPGNRKILSYLREFEDHQTNETILCVANLARAAQAVELDLSHFSGRVPVDIVGGSAFPPIGQLTYLLTLPPYGFFWFLLTTQAQLPSWHIPAPEPLPEFVTLVLQRGLEDIFTGSPIRLLETEALPAYLRKRRWFGAKDEQFGSINLVHIFSMGDIQNRIVIAEILIEISGGIERYLLPLGIVWEDQATGSLSHQLALARVRQGRRIGLLTDAFAIDAFSYAVMSSLRDANKAVLPGGEINFLPTPRLATHHSFPDADIRRLSAEQSNSSLVFGDSIVLKFVRHIVPGVHPEGEMLRFLTEHSFANTAPLLGEVVRIAADGAVSTLALAEGFIANQGDGWTWTLDFLDRAVGEMAVTGDQLEAQEDGFSVYRIFAQCIGKRLAELHAVLALPCENPDFMPEDANAEIRQAWVSNVRKQVDLAIKTLRTITIWPDSEMEKLARGVVDRHAQIDPLLDQLIYSAEGALSTRVHGDFHLGQVLTVQNDIFIVDFEGEPAHSLRHRRMKTCPLRDVAGLLRSFDYAATAAAPGRTAASPGTGERRVALLEQFRHVASDEFLAAYRFAHRASSRQWVPSNAEDDLLNLFLVEKVSYEICYEAANRPDWLPIPLRGLATLLDRLLDSQENSE